MKLNFEQIKNIIIGAVRIEEESGAVRAYRFTKEQDELYKARNPDFYHKSLTSAGIKLLFKTDSKNLFLKMRTAYGSSRQYFSFDVFVDGKPAGYIDNFSNADLPRVYPQAELPVGVFSKTLQLGNGIKTVCVYFPWSVKTFIEEIEVDDNALVEAIKPSKKLIAYGDSITHGYDALRPSNRYIARLAEALDAEEYNKAIGGEVFLPDLSELKDSFVPDYVTVAYGTNDWNCMDSDTFKHRCRAFYENLSRNYPDTKIFAITPIWRKDINVPRSFGAFSELETYIKDAVRDLENVTMISGFDLVPEDEKYYADLVLHPNDEGFDYYFKGLYNKIKSHI